MASDTEQTYQPDLFTSIPSSQTAKASGQKIKTLSLFSGAGGLDIGFHQAGFEILGCVELMPAYCKTLAANAGSGHFFAEMTEVHCGDIKEFDPALYAGKGIECVIGGPPCQTFSAAGRRSGGVLGTIDARGRLFESYCHILDVLKPKVFVFENVYGLPGANGGGPWREICASFSALGYSLKAEVVDAADYGVAQHRERLIIVGYRSELGSFNFPEPTHGPDSSSGLPLVTVRDSIADLQDPLEPYQEFDGLYGHLLSLVPEGLNYSFFTREMGYPKPFFAWRSKFHDFLYKVDQDYPSRTIKAQPGKFTGPFHWKNRHFNVAELKRLQSFPDNYEIVGSYGKVVEQIGNSVPPKLAEVIAISVKEQLLRPTAKLAYPVRSIGFTSTFRQRQRLRTLHYKKVALEEIASRFPNVSVIDSQPTNTIKNYFVGYEGFFTKDQPDTASELKPGYTYYSVNEIRAGAKIEIKVEPIKKARKAAKKLKIEIHGLSKYLLEVDTLVCHALLDDYDDLFRVWRIIESTLIDGSQFYTLIDIYGHYANRGDTVVVKTEFSSKRKSLLDRALEFFGSSENAGSFISRTAVSERIDIGNSTITDLIADMRSMRWDVRSLITHPTIRHDAILCTYPFPLLSGKAQLERKLNIE
ncbi:DNA cytosine methyltransferase [Pseudomonas coronafaciens]|uniref:DNA cytosine methyltransferase n=1 Tax=Pseudomonas coronafaciens TaxID=53409 RepID=UPI001424B5CB|nr:DNA cytosine methyltransferase [Pseudomonas coronafaciens]QIQ72088.1 Modification methylase BspRI [Pseudomonas coronafaciens]